MKTTLICTFFLIVVTSCVQVKFKNPQPANGTALTEFPKEIIGQYVSKDNDTLDINIDNFMFGTDSSNTFFFQGNLKNNEMMIIPFNSFYLINLKSDDNYWTVTPLEIKNNQILIYGIITGNNDSLRIESLKNITNVTEITKNKEEGRETIDYYLVDPNEEELQSMFDHNIFVKSGEFIKIEK